MNLLMRVTTFEELKNRHIGVIGTAERDAYEAEVREAIHTCHVKESTKVKQNIKLPK